jgi:hypothetical protein
LLGESFKRQLKFDGTYSRITFICSKTDDISITEASDSLGLQDEFEEKWDRIAEIEKKRDIKQSVKDLRESKAVYGELINNAEEAIEEWEKLKDDGEDGKSVWAPNLSKKRKRSTEPKQARKKSKSSKGSKSDNDSDSFIDDDEEADEQDKASDVESDSG